jgi:hypothetical protein
VDGGTILIQSGLLNSRVHITVNNSGPGDKRSRRLASMQARGIGLTSAVERSDTLYRLSPTLRSSGLKLEGVESWWICLSGRVPDSRGDGARVMIVDDEPLARRGVRVRLGK